MEDVSVCKGRAWEGAVIPLNWRLKNGLCLTMGGFNEMGQGLRFEEEPPFPKNKMSKYFHR
jgi:hypothetical protein